MIILKGARSVAPNELRVTLTTKYSSANCAEFLGLCFIGELDPLLFIGITLALVIAGELTDFLAIILGEDDLEFDILEPD